MKTQYLEKRLDKEKVADIEAQAEVRILHSMQNILADTVNHYMEEHKLRVNELVRKLDWSPTQLAATRRGKANLRLSSLVRLLAVLGKELHEVFGNKK